MNPPRCLQTLTYDIPALVSAHPPVWRHPHKQAVYDRVVKEAGVPEGALHYLRWETAGLEGEMHLGDCALIAEPGFYSYPATENAAVWHLNFADPRLFAAYGSSLLAQDELQALEHPVLGSVREALLAEEHPALTRQDGRSTPVLVVGAPRQCALRTEAPSPANSGGSLWTRLRSGLAAIAPASGPSSGLYGNQFQRASLDQVMSALTVLKPPTLSNIIAIAAPTGQGRYTGRQIADILETAHGGMRAAVLESRRVWPAQPVEIHTGWWGCGAFGGNRPLMALLQVLAARMAGVHRLVFHHGESAGKFDFEEGCALLQTLLDEGSKDVPELIGAVEKLGFVWGVSDGN